MTVDRHSTDPLWRGDAGGLPERPTGGASSNPPPPPGHVSDFSGPRPAGTVPERPTFRSPQCTCAAPWSYCPPSCERYEAEWRRIDALASGGTITPPEPAEPEPVPLTAREFRIADAEYDLMSALRVLQNATDWLHRAQANLRKARQS